ncbi:hypothetical protein AcW1_006312 [Taiwanofungus camphoratus]|nr:hypothetical protein AcW2_005067 [Antrodia cinnamomea]KAI0934951.1 hypothetical protein AcV5_006633 [Antrodia cinnamomea]KAI0949760.1 hypothetical protein AcV7_008432 [Antrodia cinnamomea]KAI0958142.1 hypothetical protein AcW1_006312 [Antrodia cinnamomea]
MSRSGHDTASGVRVLSAAMQKDGKARIKLKNELQYRLFNSSSSILCSFAINNGIPPTPERIRTRRKRQGPIFGHILRCTTNPPATVQNGNTGRYDSEGMCPTGG